jgi:hypothetical protein
METSSVEKKSPIEFLIEQLYKKGFLKEVDGNEPINLMNQAKEMEKQHQKFIEEEIKEAYSMGRLNKSIKDFNQRFKLKI